MKSLTNYTQNKYLTVASALKAPEPSVGQIRRDFGEETLEMEIIVLIKTLFNIRHSKDQFKPELSEAFMEWLLSNYWYLKLPEIELAFKTYQSEKFEVRTIDLETLQTIIETFVMKRTDEAEKISKQSQEMPEPSKTAIPMPDETKKLWDKIMIQQMKAPKPKTRMPKDLTELFSLQHFKEPERMAERMIELWKAEYDEIVKDGELYKNETLPQFLAVKKAQFIHKSNIRVKL